MGDGMEKIVDPPRAYFPPHIILYVNECSSLHQMLIRTELFHCILPFDIVALCYDMSLH